MAGAACGGPSVRALMRAWVAPGTELGTSAAKLGGLGDYNIPSSVDAFSMLKKL